MFWHEWQCDEVMRRARNRVNLCRQSHNCVGAVAIDHGLVGNGAECAVAVGRAVAVAFVGCVLIVGLPVDVAQLHHGAYNAVVVMVRNNGGCQQHCSSHHSKRYFDSFFQKRRSQFISGGAKLATLRCN